MIKYLYYFENRALQNSLRNRGDFEIFVNDFASVGEMYLDSILNFELEKVVFEKRKITIYSNSFPSTLYTSAIKGKLMKFQNFDNGELKILSTQSNLVLDTDYNSLLSSFRKVEATKIPDNVKSTCFINNESFALEFPEYSKKSDHDHKAIFYINAIDEIEMKDKRNTYLESVEETYNTHGCNIN